MRVGVKSVINESLDCLILFTLLYLLIIVMLLPGQSFDFVLSTGTVQV